MVFNISYDLNKPCQDYEELYEAIKELGSWWHYLDSTWLVSTNLNASQIFSKLKEHIDANDNILVISVGNDYSGWLPKKAWEWIKDKLSTVASYY